MAQASSIFDDLEETGEHETVSRDDQLHALREVVRTAQTQRLPAVDVVVEPASSFDVLGEIEDGSAEARGDSGFAPATRLPLLQRLYRKFASSAPRPRAVRVDTEESYAAWKDKQRAPYLAELERLMEEGADEEQLEVARCRAAECGERVPVSLPPHAHDKVESWQAGDEIFTSVRLRGADGKPRIATTSTTPQQHVEQVVGYASDAGVDPFSVVGVLPALAQVLGGGSLVAHICRAAPQLMSRPEVVRGEVFVGVVKPKSSPAVAAAMALVQNARRGDSQARNELEHVAVTASGKKLIEEAAHRLISARNKENG